jgi:hypothetical protein
MTAATPSPGHPDRNTAIGIVNALRRGVPPEYGLESFSVCRAEILAQFEEDLGLVRAGSSHLRYIDADLGQGKTHLLKLLREVAFRRDFIVSIVELSSAECPLYRLVDVYGRIVAGLRTRESPGEPALEAILGRWLEVMRGADPERRRKTLDGLPNGMKGALVAYLNATNFLGPSLERQDLVLRWLNGESLPLTTRTRIQLTDNIADATALAMLSALTALARDIGYAGVCVLFDEAEGIVSFARSSQRSAAVANLVRVVRQTERSHGSYFVYAATPSFFDLLDVNRQLQPRGSDGLIMSPLPLETDCLHELGARIVLLHSTAYQWEPDAATTARLITALQPSDRVSDTTRALVAALDEMREQ